jgi:hypothetical protein
LTNQSIYNQHFVALQRGFKNTPFQFELKNIRILSNRNFGVCNMKGNEVEMKRRFRAPGKAVLNVYICDTTLSPMAAFWSSVPVDSDLRPQYDGIVLLNPRLAPTPAQSITAIENIVHETGHFLGESTAHPLSFVRGPSHPFCSLRSTISFIGLYHTFEGGCNHTFFGPDYITVKGDGVDDTPAHAIATSRLNITGAEAQCWLTQ